MNTAFARLPDEDVWAYAVYLAPIRIFFVVQLPKFRRHPHRNSDCGSQQVIQRFQPQHLGLKHYAEMTGNRVRDCLQHNLAV